MKLSISILLGIAAGVVLILNNLFLMWAEKAIKNKYIQLTVGLVSIPMLIWILFFVSKVGLLEEYLEGENLRSAFIYALAITWVPISVVQLIRISRSDKKD